MNTTSASLARRWWHSRIGYRFLVEAAVMVGLFFVYKYVRFAARGQGTEAFDNARRVVDFERGLRFFTEPELQRLVLDHPALVKALNQYYVGAHFPVTIGCLAWLYVRRPLGYVSTRRILLLASGLGMLIHAAYPLAPPRMLPSLGFVDTGQLLGPAAYGPGSPFGDLANEFAAMPSLHFGWAIVVAVAIVRYGRSPLRWIIVVHPMLTTAAIVMTANHFWLDALVSGALIALLYGLASIGSRTRFARRRRPADPGRDLRGDEARVDLRGASLDSLGDPAAGVTGNGAGAGASSGDVATLPRPG